MKLFERIIMTYMRDIGESCYHIVSTRRGHGNVSYKIVTYDSDCKKTGEIELVVSVNKEGIVRISDGGGADLLKELQEKYPRDDVSARYNMMKKNAIPRKRMELMYA